MTMLERRFKTDEVIQATLVAMTVQNEWSAPEQDQMVVISFRWQDTASARFFWHKCRPFSKREDIRQKAAITLEEIDGALGASGWVAEYVMNKAHGELMLSGIKAGQYYVNLQQFGTLNPVKLIYREGESINSQNNAPYISRYIARVLPWVEGDEPMAAEEIDREVANFCMTREWLQVRRMVLDAVGSVCMCCGATHRDAVITVDHIKPRSRFPMLSLSPSNLQVLCYECNVGKGSDSEMDYRSFEQETALQALEQSGS